MKSILVVDDETEICVELARTLRQFGLVVQTVGTFEKALRALEESEFDAVLLEFNLRSERKGRPRTGAGLEIVRRFRASGMTTPILIFTAMEGESYTRASLEAGADDFIPKTDGISCLLARLRVCIKGWERGQGRGSSPLLRKTSRLREPERTSVSPR